MQHAVCIYWTFLLTFYGTLKLVKSNVDSHLTGSNDSEDSVDLLKLKLIAKRLADNLHQQRLHQTPRTREESLSSDTLILIKSLASDSGSAVIPTSKREDMDSPDTFISAHSGHSRLEVLKRYYRQSSDSLVNFQALYTLVFPQLQNFTARLKERFIPNVPDILLSVELIFTVLKPDDRDFTTGDIDSIVKKFRVVNEATAAVLSKGDPFVRPEYQSWFQSQKAAINYLLNALTVATLSLRLSGDAQIPILSGGIGGINSGVQTGIPYKTLLTLYQLVSFLLTGKIPAVPT